MMPQFYHTLAIRIPVAACHNDKNYQNSNPIAGIVACRKSFVPSRVPIRPDGRIALAAGLQRPDARPAVA
jgi:hypothetical protein